MRERRQANLNGVDDDFISEDKTEPDEQGKSIQQEKQIIFSPLMFLEWWQEM